MMPDNHYRQLTAVLAGIGLAACLYLARTHGQATQAGSADEFYDSHFHLTNYIQRGISPRDFLTIMGTRVPPSTLFGIPLQQQWSYANSGDFAPTYYLHSDAPLYYYSFTDAYIASVYRALSTDEQARFDPMITGFNPADMYAVDHIRRVLETFPGVFSGSARAGGGRRARARARGRRRRGSAGRPPCSPPSARGRRRGAPRTRR